MTKLVSYSRVSTSDQAELGVSLAAQQEKIQQYAALYGHEIVESIVDAGESAKSLDRPGIQRALEMLKSGQAEGLVVAKLDRLTRSITDLSFLVEEYFDGTFALHSVSEQIDTQGATGRLVINLITVVSQFEREIIAERTRTALQYKKSKGERVGTVPFGWRVTSDGKTLAENAHEQEVRELILRWRAEGKSMRTIVRELNARNIPARPNVKTNEIGKWHLPAVHRICKAGACASS